MREKRTLSLWRFPPHTLCLCDGFSYMFEIPHRDTVFSFSLHFGLPNRAMHEVSESHNVSHSGIGTHATWHLATHGWCLAYSS